MSETDPTSGEEAAPSAPENPPPAAPSFDFSDLRGLQSLGAQAPEDREAYALALEKELVARASRFVNSVDDSIVLDSDGVIRWLGDPIGRLIAGDELLAPRAVLLADDRLPAELSEAAEKRLLLWVGAHLRKVLGPLESLANGDGLGDGAREVAGKIASALGVLDREKVRAQVKTLDQTARAALRKLGVRFGAHYIFVPALLKPGARALCSQLQALKHGSEPGAERLLAFASSGRTSFTAEGTLSPDAYRIAGFRLCGERVVRIDIVERLTDLIRAAIPDQMRPGSAPASDVSGFLITQQMTSLTGCAGEAFAAILRSLGYEPHRVKRADFEAALKKPEPAAAPTAGENEAPEANAEATPAEGAGGEAAQVETPETVVDSAAEPPAPPAEDQAAEAAAAEEAPAPEVEEAQAAEAEEAPPAEAEEAAVPETEQAPALEAEATPTVELASESGESVAAEAEAPSESGGEPAPGEAEEDWVEVWRPAPRERHRRHHHHHQRKTGEPGRIVWRAKEPAQDPRRDRSAPAAEAATAAENPAAAPEPAAEAPRPEGGRPRHGDRRPQPPGKGPRRDDNRPERQERGPKTYGDGPSRRSERPTQVDPDSPFAKLLALKPLLERQDKRK